MQELVSVVVLVGEGLVDLEQVLMCVSDLLASRAGAHELIVVANGRDEVQEAALQRASHRARVFVLTRQVDAFTAAWRGIENAHGARVAVVDATSDDLGMLPELLSRAEAGADIVFASEVDRTPPRLSRAVARRLLDTVQGSLGLTSVDAAAPRYRVLGQNVARFIAQHPDPVAAYRRLPAGASFTQAHLQYGSRAPTPARAQATAPGLGRVARGARRWASTTLDTWTRLQGHDTTFHDAAGGHETDCLLQTPIVRAGVFAIPARLTSSGPGWYAANPTLARLGERTIVNVRLVNYRKRGHGSELTGDSVYRSRNVVFDWDPQSGVAGEVREAEGVPASWPGHTRVRGLEDQRWIVHEGRLWFSACCCQVPNDAGSARMVLGRMNEALDGVDRLLPLCYDAARAAEKNWLLWSVKGQLLAIYGYHPFTLLSLDTDTGRARSIRARRADFPARRYRGSAGPVPVPGRPGHWLVLVHEVARRFDTPVYAHRWVLLHLDQGMLAYSRPFVFGHVGIEYAAGLLDNRDGTLTVTYGFEDREARWVILDWAHVLGSLYAAPRASAHARHGRQDLAERLSEPLPERLQREVRDDVRARGGAEASPLGRALEQADEVPLEIGGFGDDRV